MSPLPDRYTLENLVELCRSPSKGRDEIARVLKGLSRSTNEWLFHRAYGEPTNVMAEDWDNLLVLDACRYDLFAEHGSLGGDLDAIVSVSSTSEEFMEKTFAGQTFHDTVYVSANGFSHKLDDGIFHEFVSTYPESQRDVLNEALYENYRPETVYDAAVDTYERHRDKRLVVHFMQPHGPYFGPTAERLRDRLETRHGIELSAWSSETTVSDRSEGLVYLMDAAERGYVTTEELETVYLENLAIVSDYVERLLQQLDGKTVVTADHGELLGDPTSRFADLFGAEYEHPGYVWTPELRLVPWLVVDAEERRDIVSESPITDSKRDRGVVNNHLRALGYKT